MDAAMKTSAAFAGKLDPLMAFVSDDVTGQVLVRQAKKMGWKHNRVFKGGVAVAIRALSQIETPPLLVVDLTGQQKPAEAVAALAEVCDSGTRVVCLGSENDVRLYRELMDMGVEDYLLKPLDPASLEQVVQRAMEEPEEQPAPPAAEKQQKLGELHVFIGARGGVGTSTMALNTAWIMSHERKVKTVLVDLDVYFGAAALALDLEPGRGFRDALESPSRIDGLFIERSLVRESDTLFVLAGEEGLDLGLHAGEGAVPTLLERLRSSFDCVVVDLPRSMLAEHHAALSVSTSNTIITDYSLNGMRDTMRMTRLAKGLNPAAKLTLMANRVGAVKMAEMPRADFEKGVSHKIDLEIAFDAKPFAQAEAKGKAMVAVAKGSKPAGLVRTFCESVADKLGEAADGAKPKKSKGSLMSRLLGGKKK